MKAVIFDMDGVILDSIPLFQEVRREYVTETLGVNAVDPEELVGLNPEDEYEYLSERTSLALSEPEYVAEMSRRVDAVYEREIPLTEGIITVIDTAKRHYSHVAVASAASRAHVESVLDRAGLANTFDSVLGGDDVERSKPDPAIYEATAERLGVTPSECIVIEDSQHGAIAAKRAGMRCIGFIQPSNPEQEFDVVDEVTDVDGLVGRLEELASG